MVSSDFPQHPVVYPNKSGKVHRVLNGAFKFNGTSLNKTVLLESGPAPKFSFCFFAIPSAQAAISADKEGMVLQVGVLALVQHALSFL